MNYIVELQMVQYYETASGKYYRLTDDHKIQEMTRKEFIPHQDEALFVPSISDIRKIRGPRVFRRPYQAKDIATDWWETMRTRQPITYETVTEKLRILPEQRRRGKPPRFMSIKMHANIMKIFQDFPLEIHPIERGQRYYFSLDFDLTRRFGKEATIRQMWSFNHDQVLRSRDYLYLGLRSPGHISASIIDRKNKVVEIFEPAYLELGTQFSRGRDLFQSMFEKHLSNIFQGYLVKFINGAQGDASQIFHDGDLYCQTWIYFYLIMRLGYGYSPEHVATIFATMSRPISNQIIRLFLSLILDSTVTLDLIQRAMANYEIHGTPDYHEIAFKSALRGECPEIYRAEYGTFGRTKILATGKLEKAFFIKDDENCYRPDLIISPHRGRYGQFKDYESMIKSLKLSGFAKIFGLSYQDSLNKFSDTFGIDLYHNYFTIILLATDQILRKFAVKPREAFTDAQRQQMGFNLFYWNQIANRGDNTVDLRTISKTNRSSLRVFPGRQGLLSLAPSDPKLKLPEMESLNTIDALKIMQDILQYKLFVTVQLSYPEHLNPTIFDRNIIKHLEKSKARKQKRTRLLTYFFKGLDDYFNFCFNFLTSFDPKM